VTLASGGVPVAHLSTGGIRFEQLTPIRSDGTRFTTLLTEDGTPAGDRLFAARRAQLEALLLRDEPDILITELFPFGRRVLRDEFGMLLERAKRLPRPPAVFASIRDILAPPSKPARVEATEALIAAHYDAVLVHSDEKATALDASWPVSGRLRPYLRYTGYVAPPPPLPHPQREGLGEVLVSAGGGGVGDALFSAAIAAAALDCQRVWRLLVGGSAAGHRIAALRAQAGSGPALIEPARSDFRNMLCHAAASVSMCGYNTALDLLQTGAPAVLVPFDDAGEVEQGLRARALSRLPGFEIVPQDRLSGVTLLEALTGVTAAPRRDASHIAFDGAARSVAIATRIAGARP
jgi:predicted glycosyltransferase